MTSKFRARFDGKALIPLEPVDIPTGQELEVEAHETQPTDAELRRGSPQAILKLLRELPPIDPRAIDEMERMIEEGKMPVRYDGVFDDLK